jgi:hypothetical protein
MKALGSLILAGILSILPGVRLLWAGQIPPVLADGILLQPSSDACTFACDTSLNTAGGNKVLQANTTGNSNTGFGDSALSSNTTGIWNTATGTTALQFNTTGSKNTATGYQALLFSSTGSLNTADGTLALHNNTTGSANTAVGYDALFHNKGNNNTAIGLSALFNNSTGGDNIALGNAAGSNITAGSFNIDIGNEGLSSDSAVLRIGRVSPLNSNAVTRTTFIAGISGTPVTGGVDVVVNTSGQLGILPSSARYKRDIKDMGASSTALLKLRPVTFRYKQDKSNERQYGLVAEEVQRLYPELVTMGTDGRVQSVRYQELIPMLLNELQKQNTESQQQTEKLRKQAAEIDRLSAQMGSNQQKVAELQVNHERELRTLEASFEQRLSALEQANHTGTLRPATLMR